MKARALFIAIFAIAFLCLLGATGSGPSSQSNLQPPTESTLNASNILLEAPAYSSGGWGPSSIVVADVNGDGKPDLLIAHDCQSSSPCPNGVVSVLLGNGDGTFQSAVDYNSGGSDATSIAVGDMNGDGKPDVVVANRCPTSCSMGVPDGLVSVLLGNGDGTFQSAVTYDSGGGNTSSVAIGDVNGDGKPDVVAFSACNTSNCTTSVVGVLLGNGDGTFKTVVTYKSGIGSGGGVVLADVNADKKLDIVVANPCSSGSCHQGSVGVLLGKGDGTFKGAVTYASGGAGAGSIAVADVNGDGRPDIVVANSCPIGCTAYSDGVVGVLLGNGDGTFQAVVGHDSGGVQAGSVAVADVNGDGKADIVVTNGDSNSTGVQSTAAVLLGNGNGTFAAAVVYDSGGDSATAITVADVNRDGKPDLVVVNVCAAHNSCLTSGGITEGSVVAVLLGNGKGAFQAARVYATGESTPSALAVGDVNGDHVLDLVVANECPGSTPCSNTNSTNGTVAVLRGKGDGTFQKAVLYNSGGVFPMWVAVADLNGDGKPDIIVANLCPNQTNCRPSTSKAHGAIGVLLNNGNGTFKAAVDYDSGGPWASSVAVADVNGDGKPDIIVTNQCPYCGTVGTVAVLLGNGDGTFQTAVTHSSGGFYPVSVAVADVNGDGKADIIVGNECLALSCAHGEVGVLLGNGDGTFKNVKVYSSGGSGGYAVGLGDFNGDGKPDVVIVNTASVAVLLGNGDGTFQAAILTATPNSGGGQLALADFNGDGKLDVASGGTEALLLGNGDGTFQELTMAPGGLGAAVGDFNGDGKPDLAVGGVEVLLAK